MYTNKQRKSLVDKICALSATEHREIFKILSEHNISYSQNKNGIFFNISTIPDDVVDEINGLVRFCINQQQELEQYDMKINECKLTTNIQRVDIKKHFEVTAKQQEDESNRIYEKLDVISSEKLNVFVEKMRHDRDKIGKKRTNTNFINATKRFIKRSGERKVEKDLEEELTLDCCLVL
jgi:hypothetical protein